MHSLFDFFSLGFKSIIYTHAFSHILFVVVLCGIYTFSAWKRVATYVLLFMVGYMASFTLHTFGYLSLPDMLVTFLIPISIVSVAFANFFIRRNVFNNKYPDQNFRFVLSFVGGIIHGFSFPITIREFFLSQAAQLSSIIAFNSGIILAVGLLVFLLLILTFILTFILRVNMREWNLVLSGACAGIALYMLTMFFA